MRGWFVMLWFTAACATTPASQLVSTVPEAPGSHCATGGLAIQDGVDDNGDGVLDPAEVDETNYVCNGAAGTSAAVAVVLEPPGANCANGGHAVQTGIDVNANGTLELSEVQHTVYVCDGASGTTQLVRTEPEVAGPHCQLGGVAILVGTDLDSDGVLAPSEVTSTSYVCNGAPPGPTLVGDYMISNNLDVALLAGVTEITGFLITGGSTPLDEIRLPDLERVGMLGLGGDNLRTISLPHLVSSNHWVALRLAADGPPGTIEIPHLQQVAEAFFVSGLMSTVAAPALVSVGGDFRVQRTSAATISAPVLGTVGGVVTIEGEAALTSVDLRALTSIGGIELGSCPNLALGSLVLPPVHALPIKLSLGDMPWTTLGPFGAVTQTADLSIFLYQLPALALPNLTTVGALRFGGTVLQSVSLPALTTVTGPVYVDAPQLPACQISNRLDAIGYQGPRTILAPPC